MMIKVTCKACKRGDSFLTVCYNKFIDVSGGWCACGEITCFNGELVKIEEDDEHDMD